MEKSRSYIKKETKLIMTWNKSIFLYHFLFTSFTDGSMTSFAGVTACLREGCIVRCIWSYKLAKTTAQVSPPLVNISRISQAGWPIYVSQAAYVRPYKSYYFWINPLSLISSEDEVLYKQSNPDVNSLLLATPSSAESLVLSWFGNSYLTKVKIYISGNVSLTKW